MTAAFMARVSSHLPNDPPAKPNVLAVLVRYRFAFVTSALTAPSASSAPAYQPEGSVRYS